MPKFWPRDTIKFRNPATCKEHKRSARDTTLTRIMLILVFSVILSTAAVESACPFSSRRAAAYDASNIAKLPASHPAVTEAVATYNAAADEVDWASVKLDVVQLLDSDQAVWPADELGIQTRKKSYTGLFVRLAWHCSGSVRLTLHDSQQSTDRHTVSHLSLIHI